MRDALGTWVDGVRFHGGVRMSHAHMALRRSSSIRTTVFGATESHMTETVARRG